MRETETERQRKKHRERGRQTDKQTDRQTDRQRLFVQHNLPALQALFFIRALKEAH